MLRRTYVALSGTLLVFGCSKEKRETTAANIRPDSAALKLPSNPALLAAQLGVPADSLRAAGEERYFRQQFDSASAIWRVELTRARATRNLAAEARARMWLGLAAYRTGDYATARAEGERSLALKRQIGLDEELSRSFNGLGLLAWNEGRFRDALELFDSAVTSAMRHDDKAGIARAAGNIPLVRVELGDFDGARRGFQQAIQLGKEIGDDRTYGNGLDNLAMLEIRLGNASNALRLLSDARRTYAKIQYAPGEANALGQIATAQGILGDLQAAIAAADSALRISRAEQLQQETASNLEVLADLQAQAGNLRLSLRSLREADSLDKELGLPAERGTNLRRTSMILLALGEIPASIQSARDALGAHKSGDARSEAVLDRTQLAQALIENGDLSAARAQSDSALRDAKMMNNPSSIREASAVAARIELNAGDARGALAQLARADDADVRDWRLQDLKSEALMSLGRLTDAENAALRAIAGLERERGSLAAGPLRSAYLGNRIAPFARLVSIDIQKHDTVSAFAVAASVVGRTFAERATTNFKRGNELPIADEGERLLRKVAAIESEISKLNGGAHAEQRASLRRALESAHVEYERHLASIGRVPVDRTVGNISLARVQSQIRPDEAVLLYLSGPQRIDCFAVRRTGVRYWSAALSERDLLQRVRVARTAVEVSTKQGTPVAALGQLHDFLVEPALTSGALSGVARVSIVLSGNLGALPFAALWNRRTGHFLIQDRELSYLPSLATSQAGKHAATTTRLAIFAPFPDSLPGTASEARIVARLMPQPTVDIGNYATERDVRAAIAAGRSVHIASHGEHNAQNPLFSRITVGRARGKTSADDGRLEVHEILRLTTTSPLVFLSGCETALGSAADGPFGQQTEEGSLSQAFLNAGAQTVVATLWRVNDRAAVRIAESFYRNLRAGMKPQDALAKTQRDEIARTRDLTWAAYSIYLRAGQ